MAGITIGDVVRRLNAWAPGAYQENYDNAQLICGDPSTPLKGIVVCLDSVEAVIDEAIELGCNMVVAHHPILFRGLKSLTGRNYVERTLIKAIKHDIAIFAAHTNLDNIRTGVNARICEKIGLKNARILAPKSGLLQKLVSFIPEAKLQDVRQAVFDAGAGVIGDYDQCSFSHSGSGTFRGNEYTNPHVGEKGKLHTEAEARLEVILPAHLSEAVVSALRKAHPYEEVAFDLYQLENNHPGVGSGMIAELPEPMEEEVFLDHLKSVFGSPVIRHTELTDKPVRKVAVCGGAGSFLLGKARAAGADAFVTADYKYHEFFDAEGSILIADVGHFESEQFTINLMAEWLGKEFGGSEAQDSQNQRLPEKFGNFAVHLTSIKTNPVKYR